MTYLEKLRNTFSFKALDFYFGVDDPHYREIQAFQDEQLRLLREMPSLQSRPFGTPSDTYLHSLRVAEDIYSFARYVGMSEQISRNLRWAVMLHDIGKMDIPSEILDKPEKLTDDEFFEMKRHTLYGVNRLKQLNLPDHPLIMLASEIAKYHHERHDGYGYYGMKGSDIPSRVRMTQLCDIYDAVSAPRIYRSSQQQLSPYETMKNMLDPHGFLYGAVDQRFAVPFCLLKTNLLDADLSQEVHKILEQYLINNEVLLDNDFTESVDTMPDID